MDKQIKLKDNIQRIDNCNNCPCFNDERCQCNITSESINWNDMANNCPLEDYNEENKPTPINMGILIGKYLREINQLSDKYRDKSDKEIGEIIFNISNGGELYVFMDMYRQAKEYFNTKHLIEDFYHDNKSS